MFADLVDCSPLQVAHSEHHKNDCNYHHLLTCGQWQISHRSSLVMYGTYHSGVDDWPKVWSLIHNATNNVIVSQRRHWKKWENICMSVEGGTYTDTSKCLHKYWVFFLALEKPFLYASLVQICFIVSAFGRWSCICMAFLRLHVPDVTDCYEVMNSTTVFPK